MSSSNSLPLEQTLTSISQSIANGDFNQSNESTSHLVQLLDSISSDDNSAFEALEVIYNYLISPSLDQVVTDALSFDLPKAVAKLGCKSKSCFEYAERIVNHFVESCSPRDMVSILCEAMNTPSDECKNSSYFSPLLGALAKGVITRMVTATSVHVCPTFEKMLTAISAHVYRSIRFMYLCF